MLNNNGSQTKYQRCEMAITNQKLQKIIKRTLEEAEKREKEMSNEELLKEVLWLAQGDDYDGAFTPEGMAEFEFMKRRLEKRLGKWLGK